MTKRLTTTLLAATALTAFLASAAPRAKAAVQLMVNGATITDNGPGDLNPNLGAIANIAAAPGFGITINSGTTSGLPSIDISSDAGTTTAAGNLVIEFTETGLTSPVASWFTQLSGNWTGGSASVQLQSFIDPTDAAFGMTTTLATLTGTATPFALSSTNAGGAGSPYSLTEVLTLTSGGAGRSFSVDASLSAVPEPMSIAMLGSGLVGLGLARRRKKA